MFVLVAGKLSIVSRALRDERESRDRLEGDVAYHSRYRHACATAEIISVIKTIIIGISYLEMWSASWISDKNGSQIARDLV